MFIGYFTLANGVTLFGLASSIMAVFCSSQGEYKLALGLLLLAGLCDMCDGRIARRGSEGRARREKIYGIQLDSLADVVSFGVTPALIAYNMGFDKTIDLFIYIIFIICGAIRLAYFNTQALSDTQDLNMKHFTGVPIPFSCVSMPVMMLIWTLINNHTVSNWIFRFFFLMLGIAYIIKVKVKKPPLKSMLVVVAFDIACLILFFIIK